MSTDDALLEALQGIPNACCPAPGVVMGGQLTADQVRAAKAAGAVTLLDSRDPMEPRPLDEPAVAAEAGLRYVNIPITGGTLDDPTLERILVVLRDPASAPVVFHCASGNRVAGALIPYLMLDRGMDEEQAVALAMRAGLRGADLMQWGLDYAARHRPA